MSQWKEILHHFGIAIADDSEKRNLTCYQMIRLYMAAKQRGGAVSLPISETKTAEAEKFAAFLTQCKEALEDVTPGLPQGFYTGNSTLSRDKRTLYLFDYSIPSSAIMVKGIKNKIISISVLQTGVGVNRDTSVGLGSPGNLWLKLPKDDAQENCTVIKIVLKGELDLFLGTGAPITKN